VLLLIPVAADATIEPVVIQVAPGSSARHRLKLEGIRRDELIRFLAGLEYSNIDSEGKLKLQLEDTSEDRNDNIFDFTYYQRGNRLPLKITASDDCNPGPHEAWLKLDRLDHRASDSRLYSIDIPLHIQVQPDHGYSAWFAGVSLAISILAAVYLYRMGRHSRWLSADDLGRRLEPLIWNRDGAAVIDKKQRDLAGRSIASSFSVRSRIRCWLQARPHNFALSRKKRFVEAVELFFHANNSDIAIDFWGLQNFPEFLEKEAIRTGSRSRGRLFAWRNQSGQVELAALLPEDELSIGALKIESLGTASIPTDRGKVFKKLRGCRLVRRLDDDEKLSGRWAGWRIK
jgi:hypothetical protein